MTKEKILEVNNLEISFKTDNGLVRAVRGVSFDLYKGETLCIVGESGSGKSVTSKAIMGILANNAIVENGNIIYDGEDLLEISEEEFHKIRGHKIGMIFQDPLSSLNPIMKVGKQITEATILNGNKLKKLYEDNISEQLINYKNALTKRNNAILKIKRNLEKELESSKDKIKEIKDKAKEDIKKIKLETKEKLPTLKYELKEAKKQARQKVKEYKKQVVSDYKNDIEKIKIEVNNNINIINDTYISLLKKAKEDYLNNKDDDLKNKYLEIKNEYLAKLQNEKNKIIDRKTKYIDSLKITHKEAKRRALEIMREVGIPLPEKRFKQYPFEFSGGMRQRIVIAIALTATPEILICDEPTTALDVTIQAQILELIKKIQKERNIACIFITHDLGVVANLADRVAVMYAGKIVEYGNADEIFFDPKHPYTWALLSSIPDVDSKERLDAIPGTPPNMIYPPKGDAFALRSKYAMKIDFEYEPPFFKVSDTHYAATWLLHENALKVEMPSIVKERINNALSNIAKKDYDNLSSAIKNKYDREYKKKEVAANE